MVRTPDSAGWREGWAARRLSASGWSKVRRFLGTPDLWWRYLSLARGAALQIPFRAWTVRRLANFTLHVLLVYRELLRLPPAGIYDSHWLASETLALSLLKRSGRAGFSLQGLTATICTGNYRLVSTNRPSNQLSRTWIAL